MIKNKKLVEKLEKELIRREPVNIEKNLKIFNTLLKFAKEMKKFPTPNPLEGIEIDIKYARAINGIKRTS
jgi:hypothetical protein